MKGNTGKTSIAGVSLESPETDYYNPADSLIENKSKQSNFDIAGRYKYLIQAGPYSDCRNFQENTIS